MKNKTLSKTGFDKEVKLVEQNKCPFCGCNIDILSFKDRLSLKEYYISGLCQQCQDKTFGK